MFSRFNTNRFPRSAWEPEQRAATMSPIHTVKKSSIPPRGGAVVELIVVGVVVAFVMALILPAIQASRESARRLQCQSNIKLLIQGCMSHEEMHGHYPTGGWGFAWTGDADLEFGQRQPGGWLFNIMPYLSSSVIRSLSANLPADAKNAAHLQQLSVPTSLFYCPTRRSAVAYPWKHRWSPVNSDRPRTVGRTDYAANGGDAYTDAGFPETPLWNSAPQGQAAGPESLAEGGVDGTPEQTANAAATFANVAQAATGVIYCGSMATAADVFDGIANTYLLGEKSLSQDWYATGDAPGDEMAALSGDCQDVSRWTFLPPHRDENGYLNPLGFGSAHNGGFYMGFCDGNVRFLSFGIYFGVHRSLGNRYDGRAINMDKLPVNAVK
jgi:prepilin-type processing-associated H-X9-DG protein